MAADQAVFAGTQSPVTVEQPLPQTEAPSFGQDHRGNHLRQLRRQQLRDAYLQPGREGRRPVGRDSFTATPVPRDTGSDSCLAAQNGKAPADLPVPNTSTRHH